MYPPQVPRGLSGRAGVAAGPERAQLGGSPATCAAGHAVRPQVLRPRARPGPGPHGLRRAPGE
eukprot:387969-Pyramimonas_sp.AAC.1